MQGKTTLPVSKYEGMDNGPTQSNSCDYNSNYFLVLILLGLLLVVGRFMERHRPAGAGIAYLVY
jgi:hypothetical protein